MYSKNYKTYYNIFKYSNTKAWRTIKPSIKDIQMPCLWIYLLFWKKCKLGKTSLHAVTTYKEGQILQATETGWNPIHDI